jgi:peptidoglycan/xylan/chitin deacetylase (PgdA/CDA1 family)
MCYRTLTLVALLAACDADPEGYSGDAGPRPDAEPLPAPLPLPDARVYVSLTFDDGWAEQFDAIRDYLASDGPGGADTGARATIYVNAGFIGAQDRVSWEQLHVLEAEGHEIGGHTAGHRDMSELSRPEQIAQICNDRRKLIAERLIPHSFAFPYGHFDDGAKEIVRDCGYASARLTRGLACSDGCPDAEPMPLADVYSIRALPAIDGDPLEEVKARIETARDRGGWVPITFHHIALDGSCNIEYCWDAERLRALVAWLQDPEQATYVAIVRVDQIVHPIDTSSPSVPSLVTNGALEREGPQPATDCVQRVGRDPASGTSYARVVRAPDGDPPYERIVTTQYERPHALIVKRDRGACAPFVFPGERYELSLMYKTNAWRRDVWFIASGRVRETDDWIELLREPVGAGRGDDAWHRVARSVDIPDGIENISFGLSLRGLGSLLIDDLAATPR